MRFRIIKNNKLIYLLILLICAWICLLFIESSQPPAPIFAKVPGLDKVAHFLAFGILALLLCALTFKLSPKKTTIPLFSFPLFMVIISGVLEESYQLFIPGRTASILDLLADIFGAVIALVLANWLAILSRNYARPSA